MILEGILSIIPLHAIALAYGKIVFRARFYVENGIPNADPWGYSGCRIQLYAMSVGMIIFPLLSFLMQRKKRVPLSNKQL